jgi:Na+/proline symporter
MILSSLDWIIIALFFAITLSIGVFAMRKAGSSTKEFFLSGQSMPWWLLGVSMVATTFSADTPNLVTDIIRKNGIAGNWAWWAFLLTGMLTVFVYAKLWRRSGILTDLEFYELRYSGKAASFLRAFRAIYLGVFFNIMIMASVMLAGIKIGGIMLGLSPVQTVLLVGVVTVIYSSIGGLRGVILTDFFQFGLSMIGMIAAAIYIVNLPEIGSLDALFTHPNVRDKLDLIPDLTNWDLAVPLFFVPIAVQWWSAWYPGAEPGGGGYIAQRMLSAKDEKESVLSTLFFNVAHYALRPWPWILIALGSLILFPDLQSIRDSFPNIDQGIVEDDLAFPAMLTLLPQGLIGLLIASLLAALMSTISTHLNWGSSYVVNDFYQRFIDKDASEKTLVSVGRISTVGLMVFASIFALFLTNAFQVFNILLQIGAGTGLLFILRWFWWRINAFSEIVAMAASFFVAIYFQLVYTGDMLDYEKLITGVVITSVCWIAATFFLPSTNTKVLKSFYKKIRPYKFGWKKIINDIPSSELSTDIPESKFSKDILMMFLGCGLVYAFLFGIGYLLYGKSMAMMLSIGVSMLFSFLLYKVWKSY